jgi:hypothetical protein
MTRKLLSTVVLIAGLAMLQSTPTWAQNAQQKTLQTGQGTVNLTPEQQARIRERVLAGNEVPRSEGIDFDKRVGTVVPTSIRVAEVPAILLEIYPQWRGYSYFVAKDDIIIVDQGHRIISVVAVGSGGATK